MLCYGYITMSQDLQDVEETNSHKTCLGEACYLQPLAWSRSMTSWFLSDVHFHIHKYNDVCHDNRNVKRSMSKYAHQTIIKIQLAVTQLAEEYMGCDVIEGGAQCHMTISPPVMKSVKSCLHDISALSSYGFTMWNKIYGSWTKGDSLEQATGGNIHSAP